MNSMEVIYIGRKFYCESGTTMSSTYLRQSDGSFTRYDWGKLECDLTAGKTVTLRPATDAEFRLFQGKLDAMKRELPR